MTNDVQLNLRHYRRCEVDFRLELSRGATCIASSRTRESLRMLIRETLDAFIETHGAAQLPVFRTILAERLVARGRPDAADEVILLNVDAGGVSVSFARNGRRP
jgi:hypothetical protein